MINVHRYRVPFSITSSALAAGTAKTMVQIATVASRRIWIEGFSFSFGSTTATDASVLVELIRWTTAGTVTAVTPVPMDPGNPAALTVGGTAAVGVNATVEPGTLITTIDQLRVTPIGGIYTFFPPPGSEYACAISSFYGFRLTSPAAQTYCAGFVQFRE